MYRVDHEREAGTITLIKDLNKKMKEDQPEAILTGKGESVLN